MDRHGDAAVATAMMTALGRIGDKRAVPVLLEAMKDKRWPIRREAGRALGRLKARSAVPALIAELKRRDGFVTPAAARALGEIGDQRAIEPLIDAMKDVQVRAEAARALINITGEEDVGYTWDKWHKWWQGNKPRLLAPPTPPARRQADEPATQAGGSGADRPRPGIWRKYPALKKRLDADVAAMRVYLKSLEPAGFAAEHPKIAEMAASKDPFRRSRALKAIAALRDPAGIPILAGAVENMDRRRDLPQARRLANLQPVMSLADWIYEAYHAGKRRPPRKLRPLLPLFVKMLVEAGDEPNVRARCLQAIGCLAGAEWLPLVKDLAPSRHPAVTHWSSWAITQLTARAEKAGTAAQLGSWPTTHWLSYTGQMSAKEHDEPFWGLRLDTRPEPKTALTGPGDRIVSWERPTMVVGATRSSRIG